MPKKREPTDYGRIGGESTRDYQHLGNPASSTESGRFRENDPSLRSPEAVVYSPPAFGTQIRFAYNTIKRAISRWLR